MLHGVALKISNGRILGSLASLLCCLGCQLSFASDSAPGQTQGPLLSQRAAFARAWEAARTGDRATFEREKPGLEDYLLYPYLEYDTMLRSRRTADPVQMAAFLEQYQYWAFAAGLERSWLRTLGEGRRWDALLAYGEDQNDTEVRCYLGQARIARGETEDLMPEARSLWLAGKSQPKACDPVFKWLIGQGGVTSDLAWARINLAIEERNPYLVGYLSRFLDPQVQVWAERWRQQDSQRYGHLDRAGQWPDSPEGRDITDYGLRRLPRSDDDRAWKNFGQLDGHFSWSPAERAAILREIALWSAVDRSQESFERMRAVPAEYRDGTLLEWWARAGLAMPDWIEVSGAIEQMPESLRDDDRWRYWQARAALETGEPELAEVELRELASRATYYGFLAADQIDQPYAICAETPDVEADAIRSLRSRSDFARALELKQVGLDSWARAEWTLAAARLDTAQLRAAAALALEEGWVDVAIMSLADSGDFNWYEWRFPLAHHETVKQHTGNKNLDSSWVMGLMRSESAMAPDAISSAGARGLMQITPATARQLSRRHGFNYSGVEQLMAADYNIELGTTYLRELLDQYGDNSALAAGAYNAGPGAVARWLKGPHPTETAIWIETLPYFETREYIPRVLAFSTIYDWRLAQPVTRISSRMPPLDSGKMISPKTTEVVCPGNASMGAG
jgi:soluble lytic murein transglycosylase